MNTFNTIKKIDKGLQYVFGCLVIYFVARGALISIIDTIEKGI